MLIFYLVGPAILLCVSVYAVKLAREKKYLDLVSLLMLVPFVLFITFAVFWGGSTFHYAQTEYEAYQPGHYYLMSHGDYTEVSALQYGVMTVLEFIGFLSLPLNLVWEIIRRIILLRKKS